jgi:peroxiredoxin Q/BCP
MISMKNIVIAGFMFFSCASYAKEKLVIGEAAPTTVARTDTGAPIDLADIYKKNRYVVIFFYPKANTPGCTAQACSLRDSYQILKEKGVEVIGVSVDSVDEQAKFKRDQKLPFTLIADTEKNVVNAFGVDLFLGLAKRQAFLIKEGKLIWMDRSASTKEQAHDILKVLEAQK